MQQLEPSRNMGRVKLSDVSGRLAHELGVRVPTSTLASYQASNVDVSDPDAVVAAGLAGGRSPQWLAKALQSRIDYWRGCRVVMGPKLWLLFCSKGADDPFPDS